ncbi:condensation domain-containing protein, partial [Streptomyces viridosporus]|uniref:condensation domain-containing protein n=1 Tax=Streptomyces viridosporus TaxID=67581 RepID=UPI0005858770
WFLHKLEGPSPTYNIPLPLRLTGALDVPALRAALADVVARHESLRTVFTDTDTDTDTDTGTDTGTGACQVILDSAAPELVVREIEPGRLDAELAEAARYAFDLAGEIPVRGWLFRLAPDEWVLVLVVHHIAADGWSLAPLARDLTRAYGARARGRAPGWEALAVQYADYALWQREVLGTADDAGGVLAGQLEYWRRQLADLPEELALPVDRPRPAVASHRGARVSFEIPAEVHGGLRQLARAHGCSMFMVAHAALAALLSRFGAGHDIPIGSPIAGRLDDGLSDLVGFFVNTLVLRTDLTGNPSFAELLARVRETDLAAYAHQDVPFEQLVEALNPARSLSRHPLFQTLLTYNNQQDRHAQLEAGNLHVRPVEFRDSTSRFDLTFELTEVETSREGGAVIRGSVEYSTDLFDPETVGCLVSGLENVFRQVLLNPDRPLSSIDVLSVGEVERITRDWNDSGVPVGPGSLVDWFERWVGETPDALALVCGDAEVSYAELNARANRLARVLVERGVGAESFVGVVLPRSVELVVALLAVWKAGGAYVPV